MFKRRALAIALVLLLPLPLMGQWGNPPDDRTPAERHAIVPHGPRVAFDVLQFQSAAYRDSTRVDLYLAVPYRSLEFLYAIDKYVADYSVSVQISPADSSERSLTVLDRYASYTVLEGVAEHHESESQAMGDQRTGDHPVDERSSMRADAEQLTFQLAPGRSYQMHLAVRDFSSRQEFDTTFAFRVRTFSASVPEMSDLMVYRERRGMSVTPSIGPDVSALEALGSVQAAASGLFAELYNMPGGSQVGIVTEVFPANRATSDAQSNLPRTAMVLDIPSPTGQLPMITGAPTRGEAVPALPPEKVTPMFVPISFDDLWAGFYTVRTYVLPHASDTSLSDTGELARRALAMGTRNVIVTMSHGIPIAVTDLDQAIDQLRLIATGTEWDSLSAAHTPRDKRNAILDFWAGKRFTTGNPGVSRSRRPSSNRAMEIFYSRLEYANAHFATSFAPGWKSDRGRIYIALGPPDQIDSHPEGYTQAYGGMQMPYETWGYTSLNMRYTFVDEYMLGDYRLRGAPLPEGTFIWE